MKKTTYILLSILILVLFYGARIYQMREIIFGPSCESLYETSLTEINYLDFDVEDFYQWVNTNYSVEKSELINWGNDKTDSIQDLSWSVDGENYSKNYWAIFEQGQLKGIAIDAIRPKLSGKKVVECFGEPRYYSGYVAKNEYEDTITEFVLWYPENGLIARYSRLNRAEPEVEPEINGSEQMTLIFFEPVTIESISSKITFSEKLIDWYQHVKPWPGSWERVVIGDSR